ncbi:olfactory receptor 51I2-like [Mantella aurantiaca]
MENVNFSQPSLLTLSFGDITSLRYLYCVFVSVGYTLTLVSNSIVITTILLNRSLHEPMYIFISILCFNGVYGSCAFYPPLFVNLLQKTQTISYTFCLVQVFCIHTFIIFEITILTAMAYDRYVCICNPLRYHSIMTLSTIIKLMAVAYLQPIIVFGTHFILTLRLPLCSSEILKIYCDNWSVVRLSCIDTTLNNLFGMFVTVMTLGVMPLLILYTYVQILRVCVRSSKAVKDKALQTFTPHLISITTFVTYTLFEILIYRFSPTKLPYELRVITSVQFVVVLPILNPFMYAIKMKEIRAKIRDQFKRTIQK